jgi:hypothetical protein
LQTLLNGSEEEEEEEEEAAVAFTNTWILVVASFPIQQA